MDPNGLGQNIAYAGQAATRRFGQAADAAGGLGADPSTPGGPMPDPAWDAFWGAMHDAEGVPAGGNLTLKGPVGMPSDGAMSALHRMSTASSPRPAPAPGGGSLASLIALGRASTGYKGQ